MTGDVVSLWGWGCNVGGASDEQVDNARTNNFDWIIMASSIMPPKQSCVSITYNHTLK